jgi:toxin CcdB
MSQFAVYRNPNPATRNAIPFLLDVQSDLLEVLDTRVVIPLYPASALGAGVISTLMPSVDVNDETCIAVTPELAGIPRKALGDEVGDLSHRRYDIIAALDLLLTGT